MRRTRSATTWPLSELYRIESQLGDFTWQRTQTGHEQMTEGQTIIEMEEIKGVNQPGTSEATETPPTAGPSSRNEAAASLLAPRTKLDLEENPQAPRGKKGPASTPPDPAATQLDPTNLTKETGLATPKMSKLQRFKDRFHRSRRSSLLSRRPSSSSRQSTRSSNRQPSTRGKKFNTKVNQLATSDLIDGFASLMFIILAFDHPLTSMGMAVNICLFVSTVLKIANAGWALAVNSDHHTIMLKCQCWLSPMISGLIGCFSIGVVQLTATGKFFAKEGN